MATIPDQAFLNQLAGLPLAQALAELERLELNDAETVGELATAALEHVETASAVASRWLEIGAALNQRLGDAPILRAQLSYAHARLYVQRGDLLLAENALRDAQAVWQASQDRVSLARSNLGLTQILAMQGRYAEAEAISTQAIAQLQTAASSEPRFFRQLVMAHRNLATVLVYQEKHAAAIQEFEQARQILEERLASAKEDPETTTDLLGELAHIQLNSASALMFLDRTAEAEATLHTVINLFERLQDPLNCGRARTNLGSLYLHTGRYAAALSQFEGATRDLIGDYNPIESVPLDDLRSADILLLDQANVYLALNLLPEATTALGRCEALFRATGQPYELGQTLLALGSVRLRNGDPQDAELALAEAEQIFITLQNRFWQNRTVVALAVLDYQRGAFQRAAARLDTMLSLAASAAQSTGAVQWDQGSLADAQLLRLRLYLEHKELDSAREMALAMITALGIPWNNAKPHATAQTALPHLVLRLHHTLGLLEQAFGHRERAQRHLRTAITLLENQRAALPAEEIRTAFLDDKTGIYSDLVLSLLESTQLEATAEAFAVVERARARALLERLLTTVSGEVLDEGDAQATRRAELQRQLHVLYNRLLGESGAHLAKTELSKAIQTCEAALQQLEWKATSRLPEAQPVGLAELQQVLPADQQAVIYYIAGAEVLAFVVDHQRVQVFRHLCSLADLEQAKAEWSFQLGRAEMSDDYRKRHAARFEQGWREALMHLHSLLIAPLIEALVLPRLLFIAYGSLHALPLHALLDGKTFLLERFECAYAPSASMAVHILNQRKTAEPYHSWAGLAVTDPSIPAAREEVEGIARYFDQAWLYLDEQANYEGLRTAARQADVLHLATHALFRPDNPFFSILKLVDSWVDVRTLYRLSLAARLVVLSACGSGIGQVSGGDEVIGLARGFLALGAQSLLVSLWNVHDVSSAQLMNRFYAHITGGPAIVRPAAALRLAQLEVIRQGQHPYFWAPFFVIGA